MAGEQMIGQLITPMLNRGTTTLTTAGSAIAATAGAIGSAYNVRKAREEENRIYGYSRDYLNSQYYRDPLSMTGTRSLLKLRNEQRRDDLEAMSNRAAATGATVENQLAAMKAENQTDSRLISGILQSEDARRDRVGAQQLALERQHSANLQNNFYQNAQNWQAWGTALGNAITQLGSAQIQENEQKGQLLGQLIGLGI